MTLALLQNTLLVGAGATLLATALGLASALVLSATGPCLRRVVFGGALVTLALPPFLVANTWMHFLGESGVWRRWLPLDLGSPGGAILLLGLWLWPVAAIAAWGAWQRLEPAHLEAEPDLRGWALIRFLLLPLARGPLVVAGLVTLVLAANNLAVPALLQVDVYAAEVWLSFSATFWVRPDGSFDWIKAASLSWPLVLLPLLLMIGLRRRPFPWPALRGGTSAARFRTALGPIPLGVATLITAIALLLSVGLPASQLVGNPRTWSELPTAMAAGRGAILTSMGLAATAASLGLVLAVFMVMPRRHPGGSHARSVPDCGSPTRSSRVTPAIRPGSLTPSPFEAAALRKAAHLRPFSWAATRFTAARRMREGLDALLWLPFLVPGVLIGIALIQSLNRPLTAWFYQSLGVVLLALVIRYLAIGWGIARHAVRSADADLIDAARLEGASRWQLFRHALWPQIAPHLAAAWCVVFLLCLWDVETIVLILPPGGETVALRVFNLLHYGHTAHVNALCLVLLGLALLPLVVVAALVKARTWGASRRGIRIFTNAATLCAALPLQSGCSPGSAPNETPVNSQIFDRVQVIATRGVAPGQVNKPRSVAVDHQDNLFVLDFTGRVQKFSPTGELLLFWQMPETKQGNPKGLSVDRDGNVIVVEPHYARVNLYTPEGHLLMRWGEHGTNAGQFTFPRAAAVNSKGKWFVSEYGVVDRVQQFDFEPGAPPTLRFLASFGRAGSAPGEWNRAEGLCVDARDRLLVADAVNHRIQILDANGAVLGNHGSAGSGLGELSYPYDVSVDEAGRHYVCEFGNSRIQIFDSNGTPVEIVGGPGAAPGFFNNPWGVALDSRGNLYVPDSQNHRVQKFLRKAEDGRQPAEGRGQNGEAHRSWGGIVVRGAAPGPALPSSIRNPQSYLSQRYTYAGRAYIFLYTHPFWVALGAHYFLPGDRLSWKRFWGLLLAFTGLTFAFSEGLRHFSATVLKGDFYVLLGALGWAATTLYIKKYLIRSCNAFQTLLYQLLFSAPVLFGLSFFLEGTPIRYIDRTVFIALFYQTIIVAWLSYWAWFYLLHIYPATTLAAFSFFTPISGVFVSSLLLGEPISLSLLISLALISVGIYWVNKR